MRSCSAAKHSLRKERQHNGKMTHSVMRNNLTIVLLRFAYTLLLNALASHGHRMKKGALIFLERSPHNAYSRNAGSYSRHAEVPVRPFLVQRSQRHFQKKIRSELGCQRSCVDAVRITIFVLGDSTKVAKEGGGWCLPANSRARTRMLSVR